MSPLIAPYEVSETPSKGDKQSDYDSAIIDSSLEPRPCSSPVIAPLDADPSFPPYDPKNNYLSPRPQFLRYKPNRRMEAYLSREGLNFEESKEFGDTDVSEETESGDSQKESEDGSTTETLPSEEEEEAPLFLSEPNPSCTSISTQMLKQISEAQGAPKSGFFTRSKCISLVLVLLIACVSISVMDVSIISSPVIKDLSFYKLYESSEVAALAKKKIDGLAGNLQHWYRIQQGEQTKGSLFTTMDSNEVD